MNILMLSATFPYPPSRGGTQNRTFHLMQALQRSGHSLTLVTQRDTSVTGDQITALGQWVEDLQVFPAPPVPSGQRSAKIRRFGQVLIQGTPSHVLHRYHPDLQRWVDAGVNQGRWQAITGEHSVNEIHVRPQWRRQFPQLQIVLNVHSSLYRTCANQLATGTAEKPWRDRLLLPLLHRYERQTCGKFSQIVVTTDEDQRQFQAFQSAAPVTVIANGVDLEQFPYRAADPGGQHLVFVGGLDYFVNIDAACRLGREVLPPLLERYPHTTVTLVGSNPAEAVLALAQHPQITVTGRVPSVAEYLHRGTVFVAPLRTGFGMKIKTLEAMAAGIPVVASDRGLEGITGADRPGATAALRANTIAETVAAIGQLFEDPPLRQTLSRHGRSLVESEYTWARAGERYGQLLMGNLMDNLES